jgi:hypothetical protein
MKTETLKALKSSIEKWELIYKEDGSDYGPGNCGLCMEFRVSIPLPTPKVKCDGCPVFEKTNKVGCSGTPHAEWNNYLEDNLDEANDEFIVFDEKSKQLALDELNFLKSLLPNE